MDFVVLSVIEIGLRVASLPRLVRLLGITWSPHDPDAHPSVEDIADQLGTSMGRRVRVAFAAVRRWPFGDTCLRRSLLLGHRLRHLDPVLRIGVARSEGELAAHAWLEVGGYSLDPESDRYAAMAAPGATPRP